MKTKKGGKNKRFGFTVVELLMVILIFGILMSFALIPLGNLGEISSESEAERITNLVKTWREIAISTQSVVRVSREGYFFVVLRVDTIVHAQDRQPLRKLRFGFKEAEEGVPEAGGVLESDGLAFDSDTLVFDRRGGATSGAFYLTDGERDFAIGIAASGRIKLWRWRNGNWY